MRDSQARLYVPGQEQPTLIVNDLKTGADGIGAVALWIDTGTVAHFRNLRISRSISRSRGRRERILLRAPRRTRVGANPVERRRR